MNKKVVGIFVVIALAIGGGVTYLLSTSADKTAMQEISTQQQETQPSSQTAPTTQQADDIKPGTYVEYSEAATMQASGTKLLFFHAPWCPQCRALEADIKKGDIPAGVTIFKVDYDTHQSLRQKYGVTIQTTVVRIDEQGNLVSKFVAYDEPSLNAIKENLL
jgi:thioredoxin-like negative regulator of GroEL